MAGKSFEEKIANVLAYLRNTTYPEGMNKADRVNLRQFAVNFSLEEGTLFHSAKGRKVVVVQTMKEALQLFERYHDSPLGGHLGLFKTRNALTSKYYWPGMTKGIADWVAQCPTCQKQGKEFNLDPTLRSIKVTRIWELVEMDLIGPLPVTKDGYQYILTAIDCLSRWVEAFPLRSPSASEVADSMYKMVLLHGCPHQILTDLGPEFNNKFNQCICQRLGVERSFTSPYPPQTNSLVENASKSIKRALRKMVDDNGSRWEEFLDPVLFSLRIKVNPTTKSSPFQLRFCADPVFPKVSENYPIPDLNTLKEEFCKEYGIDMTSGPDAGIALALSNIPKAQEKKQRHSAKRKTSKYGEITFDVGDCVLLLNARKRTRKGGVLGPTYRGPYKITTVEGKRVKLQTMAGKTLGTMYSITHLKPFKEPPTLAAESTAEENIRTEVAVGDTEPETPSEETGKMVGAVSPKSPESTVKTVEVRAVEKEDVSSNDTIDDDDDDVLMEDGEDRQWFLEGY